MDISAVILWGFEVTDKEDEVFTPVIGVQDEQFNKSLDYTDRNVYRVIVTIEKHNSSTEQFNWTVIINHELDTGTTSENITVESFIDPPDRAKVQVYINKTSKINTLFHVKIEVFEAFYPYRDISYIVMTITVLAFIIFIRSIMKEKSMKVKKSNQ